MGEDTSPGRSEPAFGIYGSPNPEWVLYMMDSVAFGLITRGQVDLVLDEVHAVDESGCCVRCGLVGLFGGPCWMHRIASYARYLIEAGVDVQRWGRAI